MEDLNCNDRHKPVQIHFHEVPIRRYTLISNEQNEKNQFHERIDFFFALCLLISIQ